MIDIKKLRKQNNLTQQELPEIINVNRSYIALIENGNIEPSVRVALFLLYITN